MASIEDTLQTKNATIARVNAPLLGKYPNGYIDSIKLPMALTWVMTTKIDSDGISGENEIQIDVFVQPLGQGINKSVKEQAKNLRDLFIAEYAISSTDMYVQDNPSIKIVPGSVEFGGYRDVIEAPDGTPFHGFQFTMLADAGLEEVDCGE